MAYMGDEIKCLICGHSYRPVYGDGVLYSSDCPECAKTEEDKKKEEYFKKLDAMTMEDRVRRIEEMQYRQMTQKRSSAFTKY